MKTYNEILDTEFSNAFVDEMKDRIVTSYYKYGSVKKNYQDKLIDGIKSLELRLQKYKETGNTEFLVDVANFAMIEYRYPQHENGHFKSTE